MISFHEHLARIREDRTADDLRAAATALLRELAAAGVTHVESVSKLAFTRKNYGDRFEPRATTLVFLVGTHKITIEEG